MQIKSDTKRWDFESPISCQIPYQVPLKAFNVKFLYDHVPFSEAFHALNGSLVGLVVDDTKYHINSSIGTIGKQMCGFIPTQTPLFQSKCVGLGLVRGIDQSSHRIHILSPLKPQDVSCVNLLARGNSTIELAVSFLVRGYERVAVPYTSLGMAEGIGSSELKIKHLGRRK